MVPSYLRTSYGRKIVRHKIWRACRIKHNKNNSRNETFISKLTKLVFIMISFNETYYYVSYVSYRECRENEFHLVFLILHVRLSGGFPLRRSKVKFCGCRFTLSWDTTSRHRQGKLIGWLARWQSPQSLRSPSPGLLRQPCIPPHLKLTGKFTSRELAVRWVRLRGSSSARRRNLSFEPAPASH